ncbi:MAG TPA: DUF4279 domain-containing protein [Steroidobacteraceae bacterium]|nr:DUF4279 domain-containing protein [Steroidobacteraceae bacterium]
MRARTYISIQGSTFNPREFQAHLSVANNGEVRRRKHSGAPLADVSLDYWVSASSLGDADNIGAHLCKLLQGISSFINQIPEKAGLRILAHVVLEFEPGEEPVGLYFSNEVIGLLNGVGGELDIDAVPRI